MDACLSFSGSSSHGGSLSATRRFTKKGGRSDQNIRDRWESFSALAADTPWDSGTTWSTMAFYTLTLHIPLSFGWISVVTQILQQPVLDPNTKVNQYTYLVFVVLAISLLIAQTLMLISTLILLKYTAKPQHNFLNFFKGCSLLKEMNWLLASAIGFGFLFTLVLGTSFLANRLLEPKCEWLYLFCVAILDEKFCSMVPTGDLFTYYSQIGCGSLGWCYYL
ncbi:hypothetical protein UlMin_015620 [Ulmus minor]